MSYYISDDQLRNLNYENRQRKIKKYDNIIENIAKVCHDTNRSWCQVNGDFSQPVWGEAPDWQKESAKNGVRFHINNPNADDSASHKNWYDEKIKDGWTFGVVKDPEAKTHPCLVDFRNLPIDQQIKDKLFRSVVHAIWRREYYWEYESLNNVL